MSSAVNHRERPATPTEVARSVAPTAELRDLNVSRAERQELAELLRLAKKYLWSDPPTMQWMQRNGVNLEPARFYSQLPTVDDIESSFEYDPTFEAAGPYSALFDIDHLRAELACFDEFSAEFDPPKDGDPSTGFHWRNPAFSFSDAMTYWCAIRRYQPEHIVEIGSGYSSLVAAQALKKNQRGRLTLIEPFPMPWLADSVPDAELIERPIQTFAPDEFSNLFADGDILFIDSTHTVKIGSDCLSIYLRLLPTIAATIQVHVHDIWLPHGIDRKRAHLRQHWVEQYLLYAYLLENPRTLINYGSAAATLHLPSELRAYMHGRWAPGGGSLWFSQQGPTQA